MRISTKVTGWPVYVLASVLVMCVADCSSDDSEGGSQGTFNDGPVQNLDFTVGETTGKTGPDGSFPYGSPSDQITFSVGDIVLGSGTVKSFMTPMDLVPGAVDETNDAVTNIARFLQTLDTPFDLSNGIQIPDGAAEAAAGLSVNFAQTPEAFESDPNVQTVLAALTTNPLVSAEDARAELQNTILVQLAGAYGGAFTGDGSGCWSFDVDASGAVTGTFDIETPPDLGQVTLPLMGTMPSSGAFTLTGSMMLEMMQLMLTITGTATTDGDVTGGTWTLTSDGVPIASGTYTGGKGQSCQPDGNGMDGECPGNNAARFVFTPSNGTSFTVCASAPFDCQTPADFCELQVFDIEGSDRFMQFLTTTAPFTVDINVCFAFDFVVDEPGDTGRGLSSAGGAPTGRQFGALDGTPFATGQYAYRDGGEPLGTFEFFEDGFMGFEIPVKPCQ